MRGLLVIALFAACGSDEHYTIVTVDSRPAVHGATKLAVTITTDTTMQTDYLDLGAHAFPVTFSVSGPGHTGMLGISVDATNGDGDSEVLVGRGATQATFTD